MESSRIRLALAGVVGGLISSIIGIIPAVLYWSRVNADWNLDIANEIVATSVMAPLGWLMCAVIPISLLSSAASWLLIGSFAWAVKTRKKSLLSICFAGCLAFGLFWPMTFWSMMSV